MIFTQKQLKRLIIPIVIEQILAITIGFFDTIMVSSVSEAAVSGVSLVDGINVLMINIFSAMATGGAVVCAQYLGAQKKKDALCSAQQLIITVLTLSLSIMALMLLFKNNLLSLLFGHIDGTVMSAAQTYLLYSALSYPFIALFNAGAALFRSMGDSKSAMINSLYMNVINIILNSLMIYVLKLGVAGAALATLISRIICAVIMLKMLTNQNLEVYIKNYLKMTFNFVIIKKILTIGIPNGLENGMFQMGKLLVQRLVSTFGTSAIAAHSVAFSLTSLVVVPGLSMGLAMITVIGQCVGARDYDQAKYYTKKIMKMTYVMTWITALTMMFGCRYILQLYGLSNETITIAMAMVRLHCCFDLIVWPLAFTFPNVLRASNDASFTMIISTISMWAFRFALAYVFANNLNMGIIGVWWSMIVDWCFRAVCFIIRYRSGKWMEKQLV